MPQVTKSLGTNFTVPSNVTAVRLLLRGEPGENAEGSGGEGGVVEGDLNVTPGDVLYIRGAGSGGAGGTGGGSLLNAGDGGDYIDVRQNGTALTDQVAVAAGGGGAGEDQLSDSPGGDGGADIGEDGTGGSGSAGGGGGTQTSGGASGGGDATAGARETGGDGSTAPDSNGGGGGGGYYGGGGGAVDAVSDTGGGGGGGSNYDDGLDTTLQNQRGGWDSSPEVVITYAETPSVTVDSITETGETDVRIQASNANPYDDTGEWQVRRNGTLIATEPSDTDLDYTDTDAPGGTQPTYEVTRTNVSAADSDSASIKVRLGTVSGVVVTGATDAEIATGWDAVANADTYEVLRATASGAGYADYTQIDTTTSTSYSDTSVTAGTTYYYTIRARIDGDTAYDSRYPGEVSATADLLPPVIQSTTDDSQTAITVAWTLQDTNPNGDVDVIVDGSVAATVGIGTTSYQATGFSEGTEHTFEIRRDTTQETATSASTTQYTKPTAASGLTVEALDGDDITASWVDNSSTETAYQRLTSTDGGQTVDVVGADLPADTTLATWYGLSRPDTHTLAVRAVVGSGDAEATARSGTAERYLAPSRAPTDAATWTLELAHPNGESVRVEPTDATFYPRIKALPTIQATLPPDPRWTSGAFVDTDMKAWKNGKRLPIDTCVAIRDDSGGEITLQGRGGSELRREANAVIDQKAVHDTVRDLVDGKTSYATTVDDPQASTTTNTRIQSAATLAEWQAIDIDFADDVPLVYPSGGGLLAPAQTCWLGVNDGGNMGAPSGNYTDESDGTLTNNNWEDADVVRLDAQGEFVEWTFNVAHRIPASEVGVAWRREYDSSPDPDVNDQIPFIIELDGITLFDFDVGGDIADITWSADFGDQYGVSLSPANNPHTLRFEINGAIAPDAYYRIDVASVYDKRYHTRSNFPNQIVTDQSDPGYLYLPGPRSAPEEIAVTTTDAIPPVSASGARVELGIGSTYGAKRIELSGDQGQSYPISATDTESVEGDFASLVGQVRSRITLGAQGEGQSETPVDGYARPELLSYDVFADLDDTALFLNENFQGSILDVLQQGADYDDAIWEIQWDADAGAQSLEWTRSGQRQAVADASLSDYEWEETAEDRYDRIRVVGRSIPVADEVITADHGTAVGLANAPIKPASETVEAGGTQYASGQDYVVDYEAGTLTTLSSGNITDGDALAVSYEWQPLGVADRAGATAPYTVRKIALPGLSSDRECEIAARRIRDATDDPLVEAEVTLPPDEIGLSAIDNLQFRGLPRGDYLDVNEITDDAGAQVARLGSRESVRDVVDDLERKVSSTAENA